MDDGTYRITSNQTVATNEEVNTHKPQTLTIHATKRWLDNSNEYIIVRALLKLIYIKIDNQETSSHLNLDGTADDPATGKAYEVASRQTATPGMLSSRICLRSETARRSNTGSEETLSDDAHRHGM